MARQFGELLKERSFLNLKSRELPTLQRRVYDALRGLTPSELDFILANDYAKLSINHQRIDRDTHYIICGVLRELTETARLLLTNDDILCAWQRLKELLFLKEAVKQGIIVEKPAADGSVTYWCDQLPSKPVFRQSTDITLITVVGHRPTIRVWRV